VRHIPTRTDAYRLAINLAKSFGARTIIDIGFAAPPVLMAALEYRRIIVNDLHPTTPRVYFPSETWIDWDWPPDRDIPIADEDLKEAIVVCAGVSAEIRDPAGLLAFLKRASRHASAVIVCTPERELQGRNRTEQQLGFRRGSRLTEFLKNLMRSTKRLSGWSLAEFKTLCQSARHTCQCPLFWCEVRLRSPVQLERCRRRPATWTRFGGLGHGRFFAHRRRRDRSWERCGRRRLHGCN
jgi:hypothetical protein